MAEWIHKYLEENIGSGTTIQNQQPGHMIAKVLKEIQDEVPNEVDTLQDSGVDGIEASIYDGKLLIVYGQLLPDGGADGEVLQRDSAGDAYFGPVRAL